MATTDRKLTPEQQRQVIEWLCEGLRNVEIVDELKREGVEVTPQAIDYYRGAYEEDIDAAREEALRKAAQQGFSNRVRRVRSLERTVTKLEETMENAPVGEWPAWVSKEYRELMQQIRDEWGDLKQKTELSGPGGGPVEVEHGVDPESIGDALEQLLARTSAGAGAGTDELGSGPADD